VDRSLWLLMKLRVLALLRRWKKAFSRPKGIVLAVMTALVFTPWVFSIAMTSKIGIQPPLEPIRRFAPLGIFLFTIWSLMFSAGEQSLYYSTASWLQAVHDDPALSLLGGIFHAGEPVDLAESDFRVLRLVRLDAFSPGLADGHGTGRKHHRCLRLESEPSADPDGRWFSDGAGGDFRRA
jgi:hypothetical protein